MGAFSLFQIPQSYLNDVHLAPSVVLKNNELLTKVPSDIARYLKSARRKHPDCLADSCKNSSVNWIAAGLRLQVQVMDFFFFHLLFKHALCSQVKGFRPHGLLVYRLCLPPDTPIIFIYLF